MREYVHGREFIMAGHSTAHWYRYRAWVLGLVSAYQLLCNSGTIPVNSARYHPSPGADPGVIRGHAPVVWRERCSELYRFVSGPCQSTPVRFGSDSDSPPDIPAVPANNTQPESGPTAWRSRTGDDGDERMRSVVGSRSSSSVSFDLSATPVPSVGVPESTSSEEVSVRNGSEVIRMWTSSSRVRAESIGISVARIGCEFVTIGDRGEGLAIQCGGICVGDGVAVGVGEIDKQRSWQDR
jgi:hypothetical protein